ncbi:WD40 repeat-like protein [Gymnopus androsaceus JB14]|uniref:WD40 repeat-like protein n=1 Tax=Gymnopus androsaceus JB14 TaxID=1447944 RepID=A0A6A4GS16_9AGAR|nr:WD40 repeat-like protein [Gymnopus androsaceus JB14]
MGDPLQGHDDPVTSVAFSHDGTRIVSGSGDKTVRIWDATTGAQMGDPLQGHDDWVSSVAFSHNGARIVSGSQDKTVRICDTISSGSVINTTLIDYNDSLQAHNNWNLSSDGWITFPNCPHGIVWIPSQFCKPLWRPQNSCIISRVGYTKFSFADCVYGEEWFNCVED